jgi:hypothetical protein
VSVDPDVEKYTDEVGEEARNSLGLKGAAGVQVGSGNVQVNYFHGSAEWVSDPEGQAREAERPLQAETIHGGRHLFSRDNRFIDIYQKAVEHLASEKPHTRMAALQAIGELGHDHPERRQTLAEVICGYRLLPQASSDPSETQVRGVAQEVLRNHLWPDRDEEGRPRNANFWPRTNINLKGAHLIDANFAYCEFGWANFDETNFMGTTWFNRCLFNSEARFVGAAFDGWLVSFEGARFEERAWHRWAAFNACAEFRGAHFAINAEFSRSRFSESADFTDLAVTGTGWFTHNAFSSTADFRGATFGSAQFVEVVFEGPVDFRGATFVHGAGRQEVFCSRIPEIEAACHWPEGWIYPNQSPSRKPSI